MRLAWLAALCLLITTRAAGMPLTVDDQLRLEGYGQVLIDPQGRWGIIEHRRRYDSAATYRYAQMTGRLLGTLLVADLARGGAAVPLFPQEANAGYFTGGFSPSGAKLVIYRLDASRLRVGVIDMATRQRRWFDLAPDLPDASPSPVWLDDDRLVIVGLDDAGLPDLLAAPARARHRLTAAWGMAEIGSEATAESLATGPATVAVPTGRQRTVYLVDTRTGSARPLFNGQVADIALAGDRTRLALLVDDAPVQPDPAIPIDPAFEPRRHRLWFVDMATGARSTPCPRCDVMPNLLRWSPRGHQLLFFARRDGQDWAEGTLLRWGGGGAVAVLPPALRAISQVAAGSARVVHAGWLGTDPIVFAERGARRDWYLIDGSRPRSVSSAFGNPDASIAIDGRRFYLRDGAVLWAGQGATSLTRVADRVIRQGLTRFDPHSWGTRNWVNTIASSPQAIEAGARNPRLIDTAPGGAMRITDLQEGDAVLAASPGAILVYAEHATGDGAIIRIDRTGERHRIDTINAHLADRQAARHLVITTPGPDGTELHHWLTLPAVDTGRPPQLVVVPYPGLVFPSAYAGRGNAVMPDLMTSPELLAAQGFAVLQPSIPLTGSAEPLAGLLQPVLAAMDAVVARKLAAPDRPLVLGHSFGGFAAVGLAAGSDRFAGIIATSGLYDLSAGYGAIDPRGDPATDGLSLTMSAGWYEAGSGRMRAPVWQDPDRYRRNSPFFHVERITAPMLLLHGDLDYAPVGQAERLFFALHRLGKQAQLVRYRGEAHILVSPANVRDYWRRVFAFLHAHSGKAADQPSPQ